METDLTASSPALACPACGASLRGGAPWCTLCFADLRTPASTPAFVLPVTPALPAVAYGLPAVDPLTAPLLDLVPPPPAPAAVVVRPETGAQAELEPSWPCSRCGSATPLSLTSCSGCGTGFLDAERQASAPTLVLPVVGDLLTMSRGHRMLLAVAAVLALCLPLALVTLLLTDSPPATPASGTTQVRTAP